MAISTIGTNSISGLGYGFKNRIINGGMQIDQRNAGASVSPTDGQYTIDRWQALQAVSSKYTVQQNAGSVTPPAGFTKYLGCTSSSAYSVGAAEYFAVGQIIEGFNTSDLAWGTASAASVTLSFWVRSSLTGTFGGVIKNTNNSRSYPFTYSVSSANTWEQKSITVAGDTSGTYATDNSGGIKLFFGLGVGSTYSGAAGSWSGGNYISATGATSVVGTSGATFYVTGVQLEKGTVATSFDWRPYGTELALCQRYYYQMGPTGYMNGYSSTNGSTTEVDTAFYFPVTMRSTPTFTHNITGGSNAAAPTGTQVGNYSGGWKATSGNTTYALNDANQYKGFTYSLYHVATLAQATMQYLGSGVYLGFSAEL